METDQIQTKSPPSMFVQGLLGLATFHTKLNDLVDINNFVKYNR